MGAKAGYSLVPGYVNPNRQRVLGATGRQSPTHANQQLYCMRCERCGYEYDANGCDTHLRKCPKC